MQRIAISMTLVVAMIALSGCTPFAYGGVVVFGPAEDQPEAEGGEG